MAANKCRDIVNQTLRRFSKPVINLMIVLAVFASVIFIQRLGLFQPLEFQFYDALIRQQPKTANADPIVLVEMTEADIQSPSLGHPVQDDKLAELLLLLESEHPAVIGLDIWRDVPVPSSGKYLPVLNNVLLSYSNIIAPFTFGGIAAPAALRNLPERLAFNDCVLKDVKVNRNSPLVRRGLLMAASKSNDTLDSLPFRLAMSYLELKGIFTAPDPIDPDSLNLGGFQLRPLQPNDGAYVNADTGGFQMLLSFREPGQFTRYSFTEALAGRIPRGSLRDRIVIVGVTAPRIHDDHSTPVRNSHRGIEIVALTVGQLLRMATGTEQSRHFVPDWMEDAWVLICCFSGGAAAYLMRTRLRLFAFVVAAILVGICVCAIVAFIESWWLPVVAAEVACLLGAVCVFSFGCLSNEKVSKRCQSRLLEKKGWAV